MFCGQERARHVNREDPVPVFERGLLDGLLDLDARRIDQDVETAPVGGDPLHGVPGGILRRHVIGDRTHAVRRVRPVGKISGNDFGAFLREAGADRLADAARAPGDESGLALERRHQAPTARA